jgi:hypothetical protein
MIEQERIGKARLVERAITLHRDDDFAIALRYFHDIESDVDVKDLALRPFFDCSGAAEFLSHVGYDRVVGEDGNERVGVTFIDRSNEGGYRLRDWYFFLHNVLNSFVVGGAARLNNYQETHDEYFQIEFCSFTNAR